jgi:hypothetical protein
MKDHSVAESLPTYNDIQALPEQWDVYKKLVAGIPEGIGKR